MSELNTDITARLSYPDGASDLPDGSNAVSAQWLHDFAHNIEAAIRLALAGREDKPPISDEAKRHGLNFCCGTQEQLSNEIASLRNVIQAGFNANCTEVKEAWNRRFPDEAKDLYSTAQPPVDVNAEREILLLAAERFDEDAEHHLSRGYDSTAEDRKARAHELRQMAIASLKQPTPPAGDMSDLISAARRVSQESHEQDVGGGDIGIVTCESIEALDKVLLKFPQDLGELTGAERNAIARAESSQAQEPDPIHEAQCLLDVPEEVFAAELVVSEYFRKSNIKGWRFGGCADRMFYADNATASCSGLSAQEQSEKLAKFFAENIPVLSCECGINRVPLSNGNCARCGRSGYAKL